MCGGGRRCAARWKQSLGVAAACARGSIRKSLSSLHSCRLARTSVLQPYRRALLRTRSPLSLLLSAPLSLSASAAVAAMLFEDTFEVTDVNPDGKKFDKGTAHMTQGD